MTLPASSTEPTPSRLHAWGEWLVVAGLMATIAWTTLCLGGYRAETMVGASWGVFGLAALVGVLWALGQGGGSFMFNRAAWLPVPFLVFGLASVLWIAPAKWLAWREWLLWLQMWLVFVIALHFGRGRRHTWVIVGTLVALGLTGAGMAAYQRFADRTWLMMGREQAEQFYGRSSGMFGIPNSLAGLVELMIPVCLTLLFSKATRLAAKIACAWLAALFVFALVLSVSRGGWIALGLALMLWPLLGGREWRRRLAGAAVVLVLAMAGVWVLFHFSENIRGRIQPFLEGKFEASRPIMWKAGLQIWRDHPWLGSGAASYNVLFDQYRPRGFPNEPGWTHNDYLNTLSDYGVVGFGLWFAAGGGLFWLGWQAVRRARREPAVPDELFDHWQWRLGLFLGLLAYAFHLSVDFHTKLPALAFAFALGFGLLLRTSPGPCHPVRWRWPELVFTGIALLVAWLVASPRYGAESLRYDSRRSIDRHAATGKGELRDIVTAAQASFERAVQIDPSNGQAWADLSYAIMQSWHFQRGDLTATGKQAEPAAERALALCPIVAEFWVRKGGALDMQARRNEGEPCYRRAVELAPNSPAGWYYYAYHLRNRPGRKDEALQAVNTCLALDPSNSLGLALRQQLLARR